MRYTKVLPILILLTCTPFLHGEDGGGSHKQQLLSAVHDGNEETVKRILSEHDVNINAKLNEREETALHIAAEKGHKEIVSYLVNQPNINVNA